MHDFQDKYIAGKSSSFWNYVLWSFIFVLLTLFFLEKVYLINDNIGIISDLKADTPVSFMSAVLGYCISGLYKISDKVVPVYGIFLYLVNIVSITLVIYAISFIVKSRILLFCTVSVYLSFHVFYLVRLDFTLTGIMLSGSSLLLFLALGVRDRLTIFATLWVGILFAGGYLLRKDILYVAIVFFLPVLVFIFWKINKRLKRYLIIFFLPLILAVVLNSIFEREMLKDQSYRYYHEFNKIRGLFHGYPIAEQNIGNKKILEMNNWSENDYAMLMGWTFLDEQKFNIGKLKNIFKYAVPELESADFISLQEGTARIITEYDSYLFFWGIIFLQIVLSYGFRKSVLPLSFLIYIFLCSVFMAVFLRFPARVGNPVILICGMLSIIISLQDSKFEQLRQHSSGQYLRWLAGLMLVCLISLNTYRLSKLNSTNMRQKGDFTEKYEDLQLLFNNKILIIQPCASLKYEFSDPLKVYCNSYTRIPLGWGIFSPHFYQVIRQKGLKVGAEILPSMIDNDDAYLIGDEFWCHMIRQFIKETYGRKCSLIKINDFSHNTAVMKIVSASAG